MLLRYCILLLILFGALPAVAQSLDGIVADNEGDALPAVIVVNKTKNLSTMTDADGKYSLRADKGDDLEFTYVGYYPVTFQMPEGVDVFRRVMLKKKLFTLEEVEIRPDWTPYQLDSIARAKRYALDLSRKRASSTVMGSIFSPASALAEQFNKKSKQRTRFQENFRKWESQKFVDTRYTPEEVETLTGLSGDTLAAFMNAYPMPYDYARSATDLEVKMWIKYNYREWIKKPIVLPKPIPKETADTLKKP
ncbi:carboxypeptidase-like regulatory domain-containing protein [Taibaiella helva]|uniref:carboxypeptidase-like regulatory domain-containing protein n=1 Tax=Taibaiella helva TaxID=2301235 RepID=UPI0013004256|nr:carboxypeptidase-like regulatory domain-containing protein [Taibaiella helva]